MAKLPWTSRWVHVPGITLLPITSSISLTSMHPGSHLPQIWRLPNVDSYALARKPATKDKLELIRDDLPFDFWYTLLPAWQG